MYSPLITDKAIRKLEKALNLKLIRYPVNDSQEIGMFLESLCPEGKLKRPLKPEERSFIQNERLMCKIDFRYFTERYATIQMDGSVGLGIGQPKFWESQELTLKLIAKLEEENFALYDEKEPCPGICICQHKSRQLGCCVGAGTRILTKDLQWIPIEDIGIGTEIIGSDEHTSVHRGVGRKMRTGRVIGTYMSTVPTLKLTLSDGTQIVATPHHRFLAFLKNRWQWIAVEDLKPGQRVRRLSQTWNEKDLTYEDGWYGGLMDGEGSVGAKSRTGADSCISQVAGPVLERAKKYLEDNGYKYRVEVDRRIAGDTSKLGSKPVYKYCVSGMAQIFRLLGTTRPTRFIGFDWWEGKELPMKEVDALVISIEDSGIQTVYDLQTTTHTYCAEGFISHNTMLSRLMTDHRIIFWPHTRAMGASVDEQKVQDQLYTRDKVCYENLPWFLKPTLKFDVKNKHLAFTSGSYVLYQQANQQSGLGQGSQFDVSHLTEVASWPDPFMIELDFVPTIPESPYAFCILESTAQGRGDWWHEFTEKVRMGKMYRWHYCFWPWYINSSKYRAKPPEDWKPQKFALKHAEMVLKTSPQILGHQHELSKQQLYWYEMNYNNAREKGELNGFLMNYAATVEESFQFSGSSAFDTELLSELRTHTQSTDYRSYNFISYDQGVQ